MVDAMLCMLVISVLVGCSFISLPIKWVSCSIDELTEKVDELVDEVRTIECDLDLIRFDMSHKEEGRTDESKRSDPHH